MHTYREAADLAIMCAYNARSAATEPVAAELWQMAREYRAEAARLDRSRAVELGDPPRLLRGTRF